MQYILRTRLNFQGLTKYLSKVSIHFSKNLKSHKGKRILNLYISRKTRSLHIHFKPSSTFIYKIIFMYKIVVKKINIMLLKNWIFFYLQTYYMNHYAAFWDFQSTAMYTKAFLLLSKIEISVTAKHCVQRFRYPPRSRTIEGYRQVPSLSYIIYLVDICRK